MRGVNTLRLRKGHPSCDRWMLSSRIKSKLMDGKEALSTSRGDQSFPVSHRARSPVAPSSDNQTNWCWRSLQAISAHHSLAITGPLTINVALWRMWPQWAGTGLIKWIWMGGQIFFFIINILFVKKWAGERYWTWRGSSWNVDCPDGR